MSSNPIDNGYVVIAERHAAFNADHPHGLIVNDVEHFIYDPTAKSGFVTVKSRVWKDRQTAVAGEPPDGVGNASMPIPGPSNFTKNSEVENAETSALGRALAMIGYHPKETMASADEITSKGGSTNKTSETAKRSTKPAVSNDAKQADSGNSKPDSIDIKKMLETKKNRVFGLRDKLGWDNKKLGELRFSLTKKHNSGQMTSEDYDKVIEALVQLADIAKVSGGTVE
jgi:hypothetical protein